MFTMLKTTNQLIVFILEVIMLAAFAYFGFQKGAEPVMKYTLAMVLPLLAIALWGYLAAPKSSNRLSMPYLALFRLLLFLLAAWSLHKCHQSTYAAIMGVFSIISQAISLFTEQDQ